MQKYIKCIKQRAWFTHGECYPVVAKDSESSNRVWVYDDVDDLRRIEYGDNTCFAMVDDRIISRMNELTQAVEDAKAKYVSAEIELNDYLRKNKLK